jgi:hypothetical protein
LRRALHAAGGCGAFGTFGTSGTAHAEAGFSGQWVP